MLCFHPLSPIGASRWSASAKIIQLKGKYKIYVAKHKRGETKYVNFKFAFTVVREVIFQILLVTLSSTVLYIAIVMTGFKEPYNIVNNLICTLYFNIYLSRPRNNVESLQ